MITTTMTGAHVIRYGVNFHISGGAQLANGQNVRC